MVKGDSTPAPKGRQPAKLLGEYLYRAKNSDIQLRKVKFLYDNGKKDKYWQHADETKPSGWTRGYKNLNVEPELYKFREVVEKIQNSGTSEQPDFFNEKVSELVWTDAEQDVDTAWSLGRVATCLPHGMGNRKGYLAEIEQLAKLIRQHVVIPDQDGTEGERQAHELGALLEAAGATVAYRRPRKGKDLTEHVQAKLGWADLAKIRPDSGDKRGPSYWLTNAIAAVENGEPIITNGGEEYSGRNRIGLYLAGQLWDTVRSSEDELVSVMEEYQRAVESLGDGDPYSESEMRSTVKQVTSRPRRDPAFRAPGVEHSGLAIPEQYVIPESYEVTSEGVFAVKLRRANEGEAALGQNLVFKGGDPYPFIRELKQFASAPFLPVGVLRDADGNELLELRWGHYGEVRSQAVARSIVKSGRKLVPALGDVGFPVNDANARNVELYLDAVEAANRTLLPVTIVARWLGWQRDRVFVTGPDAPYRVEPAAANLDHIVNAHHPEGTLADWQAVAKLVAEFPSAQLPLYASFAAPLLRLLRLPSFIVDLAGLTTTGKTISAELGLSVWADPSPHGAIANWNSTRVALEHRLSLARGVPVVIDETSNAPNPNDVRDMLYAIPQGRQKARGAIDGTRKTLEWETVVITTGERPITSYTTDGGTAGRVVTLERSPFGDRGGEVAREVQDGAESAYGTAGPEFIARLLEQKDADLRARHIALTERFSAGGGLQRRRAPLIAALRLAAELAAEFRVLSFEPLPLNVWLTSSINRDAPRDDRPAAALDVVWNWIAANPKRIVGMDLPVPDFGMEPLPPDLGSPQLGWAGKEMSGGAVAMNPEIVAKILADAGYALDAVKRAWAERGWIRRQGKDLTYRIRIGTRLVRWILFEERPESE
jgi:hypothetical protein